MSSQLSSSLSSPSSTTATVWSWKYIILSVSFPTRLPVYGLTPAGSLRSASSALAPTLPTSPANDHPAGKLKAKGFAEAGGGEDTAMHTITNNDTRDFNSPSAIGAPRVIASRAVRTAVKSLRSDIFD